MKRLFKGLFVLVLGLLVVGSLSLKAEAQPVEAIDGASIRSKVDEEVKQGLRFYAKLDESVKQNEHGFYLAFGKVTLGQLEAVLDDQVMELNDKEVYKVNVPGVDNNNQFSVVLTDIPGVGYLDEITAIPFVVVDEEVVFDKAVTRSIGEVALKAANAGDDAGADVISYLEDNVKRLSLNAFGELELTGNMYETNHFVLREEFIKDWNAKFGTKWTELVGNTFDAYAQVGHETADLSGTRSYQFFNDPLYKDKWEFVLNIMVLKGSGTTWPMVQAQALLGDGTVEGRSNLNVGRHLHFSIANFFNGNFEVYGYSGVNFTTRKMYDDVLDMIEGVHISLENHDLYHVGKEIVMPEAEAKLGYNFVHYKGTENNYEVSSVYEVTSSNELFELIYNAIDYTIEYYDGETLLEDLNDTYTIEDAVTLPEPVKEGFVFDGWYDNPEFDGSPITNITLGSTGNKKFYAKMVAAESSGDITYNLDGGNFYTYDSREEMVLDFMLDFNAFFSTRDDIEAHELQAETYNWNVPTLFDDSVYGLKWAWMKNYIISQAVGHGSHSGLNSNDDGTWRASLDSFLNGRLRTAYPATVDYTKEAAKNGFWNLLVIEAPTSYAYGNEVELLTPVKFDYSFEGWYLEEDFSGTPITKIEETDTGDFELYAKWKLIDPLGDALELIDFAELSISENLDLEFELEEGIQVAWESSDSAYLNNLGFVDRHAYDDKEVTLTVTVSLDGDTRSKSFTFTVLKIDGYTAEEFYGLSNQNHVLKGIVAAKGPTRMVIQDPSGIGFYIWFNTAPMNKYASEVNVGDFVVVRGDKSLPGAEGIPQLNVNSVDHEETKYLYKVETNHVYQLAAPTTVTSLDDLPEDFRDLQGKTYYFENLEIRWLSSDGLYVLPKKDNDEVLIKIAGNMLSDVRTYFDSLDLMIGDFVSFTGTFYSKNGSSPASAMILAAADDIEVNKPAGRFAAVSNDIKPAAEVEDNLTLKFNSLHGSTITWTSDNAAIEIVDGVVTVTQPILPADAVDVVLTAVVDVKGFTETYTYTVKVLSRLSDQAMVDEAHVDLDFDFGLEAVELWFILPVKGLHDVNIAWSSSDADVIEVDEGFAIVTRSTVEDKEVTLTATLTLNDITKTKIFVMTVLQGETTDQQKVDNAIENFALGLVFDETKDVYIIEEDVQLPEEFLGVDISWVSSDLSTVKNDGTYIETYYAEEVTLTATFSLNDVEETAEYKLLTEELEGYTATEFADLPADGSTYYLLKGIVAVKANKRMVVQDPNGNGFYIWLNETPMNHFASDINVGDFVQVKGTKIGTAPITQINVDATNDDNKYVVKISSDHKYELYAKTVNTRDDLPEDWSELQGKTYYFENVAIRYKGAWGLYIFATKSNGEQVIMRLNDNALPEITAHYESLNLKNGDIVNIRGTFYNKRADGSNTSFDMIISLVTDLELVERS